MPARRLFVPFFVRPDERPRRDETGRTARRRRQRRAARRAAPLCEFATASAVVGLSVVAPGAIIARARLRIRSPDATACRGACLLACVRVCVCRLLIPLDIASRTSTSLASLRLSPKGPRCSIASTDLSALVRGMSIVQARSSVLLPPVVDSKREISSYN